MKKFVIAMFALLICAVIVPSVLASVEVSVKDISQTFAPISLTIGQTVPVNVYFSETSNASDVVVEADLSYGHGKEVSDKSQALDLIAGTQYVEELSIKLPTDIEATSPGEEYTLHVRIRDSKGNTLEETEFPVTVQRSNDLLDIQKVMKTTAEAGKSTLITVVVKNIGSDQQDDIYVKVTIPELGVSAEERVGDLVAVDKDDQDNTATVDIPLRIPSNAAEGTYSVVVKVYNDNVDISKTESLNIKGGSTPVDASEVVPQILAQEIEKGKSATYGITIGNLADSAQSYTVEVSGTDGWATYAVSPLKVTLNGKDSQIVNTEIAVNPNAMTGDHSFVVTVKNDNKIVSQVTLKADVKESALKVNAMLISVIVLAVILLILVLVLIKSRKAESVETEESYY